MSAALMNLARRALPLMNAVQQAEAHRLIAQISANASGFPEDAVQEAATLWESDMQPLRTAIAAAMHSGGMAEAADDGQAAAGRTGREALQGLRHMMPGLLRQVNESPSLAGYIEHAMRSAFLSSFEAEASAKDVTANAAPISFSEEPVLTKGMESWRAREVFETDRGSAELRGLGRQFARRSIFSARTTNAEYLRDVQRVVDEILSGKMGMSEGRYQLMRKLKQLGYDPAVGFPDDYALVPPAERGSLQDLSSAQRIDLVLETNVRMARGFGQVTAGNTSTARFAFPAWELIRLYDRENPRGGPDSHSVGWQRRWTDAGAACGWVGASQSRFLALKDSPIWPALGDGEGGYTDALLNPFPPFAFRSGYGWIARPRSVCEAVGLIQGDTLPAPVSATISPAAAEVKRVVDNMPADLQAELLRELGLA